MYVCFNMYILELCKAGSSSISAMQPCDLCTKGSYQSKEGQTSCDVCPFGMSTSEKGAASSDECECTIHFLTFNSFVIFKKAFCVYTYKTYIISSFY